MKTFSFSYGSTPAIVFRFSVTKATAQPNAIYNYRNLKFTSSKIKPDKNPLSRQKPPVTRSNDCINDLTIFQNSNGQQSKGGSGGQPLGSSGGPHRGGGHTWLPRPPAGLLDLAPLSWLLRPTPEKQKEDSGRCGDWRRWRGGSAATSPTTLPDHPGPQSLPPQPGLPLR